MHEIGHAECPKAYVFRGDSDTTVERVQEVRALRSLSTSFGRRLLKPLVGRSVPEA